MPFSEFAGFIMAGSKMMKKPAGLVAAKKHVAKTETKQKRKKKSCSPPPKSGRRDTPKKAARCISRHVSALDLALSNEKTFNGMRLQERVEHDIRLFGCQTNGREVRLSTKYWAVIFKDFGLGQGLQTLMAHPGHELSEESVDAELAEAIALACSKNPVKRGSGEDALDAYFRHCDTLSRLDIFGYMTSCCQPSDCMIASHVDKNLMFLLDHWGRT